MSRGGAFQRAPRPPHSSPPRLIQQRLAEARRRAANKVAKQSRKDNR